MRHGKQNKLFDTGTGLPNGFVYRPEFLTQEEEAELLSFFEDLPFETPMYEGYAAKRRIIGFGWGYDFKNKRLIPGPPLPPFLRKVQRKIAKWLDIPVRRVVEALITEYPGGSAIGWHRDNEDFEHIIGISLSGWCRIRLRPVRSRTKMSVASNGMRRSITEVISLELEPRSAYIMQKDARWRYQHSIPPTRTLRYSITFRTLPR